MPPPFQPAVRPRPAWWWYLVIAAFAIAMPVLAVGIMVWSADDYVADLEWVEPGGASHVIQLDEGGYTVYAEGGAWSRSSLQALLHITDPEGNAVELRWYDGSHTYSRGDRHGRAMLTFHADRDGDYRIQVSGGEPSEPSEVPSALYIGRGFARHIGRAIWNGILVGFFGIVLAVGATIALAVTRGSSRRRQLAGHGL